jgi:23S rRNA (adenine2030-N6)-methyltransferase
MNYRHAYHAGNFADVLKHAALVSVLLHLHKKPAPFAVIDTHAGRGLYDLGGEEANKTREAESGIQRLARRDDLAGVLAPYVGLATSYGETLYPGSPLLAQKLLRVTDRLIAIEKHPEEQAELARLMRGDKRVRVIQGDGYREVLKLLPPRERRGLVLMDPPYEAEDEFETAVRTLIAGWRRFATGITLFWYPAKERARIVAAAGELITAGIKQILKVELDIGAEDPTDRLTATGLLVINAPFGFAAEMRSVTRMLVDVLGRGMNASATVEVLAGEE